MILLFITFCLTIITPTNAYAAGFEQDPAGETSHSFSESLNSAGITLTEFNRAGDQLEKLKNQMPALKTVPEFGGAWFDKLELNIGTTNPENPEIKRIAALLSAKVVKTQYRDSDVQHVFNQAKTKLTGYNAISYRYTSPETMTLKIAMKAGQTGDINILGPMPPHVNAEIVPMETLSQLTTSINPELMESGDIFYTMQPNEEELTCSFAFPATAPTGEKARITAGHCKAQGTTPTIKTPSQHKKLDPTIS